MLLVLAGVNAFAQVKGRFNEVSLKLKIPFTVTQYSTRDGLPQNQVSEIIPRNDQSLILNTANGVVTFNGYYFKNLVEDSSFKKQTFIKLIYIKNTNQVYGFDQNRDFYLIAPTYQKINIGNRKVHHLTLSGDSVLILTNATDIYSYHLKTFKLREIINHQKLTNIPQHLFGKILLHNKHLYICSRDHGLYDINLKSGENICLSKDRATEIKLNPYNNSLYTFVGKALYKIDSGLVLIREINISNAANVACMEFRTEDEIYVGTNEGLYVIYEDYYEMYNRNDGLFSESVYSLYFDVLQDCMFAGTNEKGLQKLQFKYNYSFSTAEGITSGGVASIIRTSKGRVLITEARGRISQLGTDSTTDYIVEPIFFSSLAEIRDTLFVGTWGKGLRLYKEKKLVDSILPPAIPGHDVLASFCDSKGNIWIGTRKGLAFGKSVKTIKPFNNGAIYEAVISIYELKNGTICIGAVGCLYFIKDGKIQVRLSEKDGLKGKEVRAFYEDENGKLWIGTYGGGLYCYDNNKLTSINAKSGSKLNEDIFCLAKDDTGYFLITSNHGLWRLSIKALNDFYDGKINYLVPFLYDEETGILNSEFNGGFQNNFLRSPFSHFYFPGIEGMVMSFPDELSAAKLLPAFDNIYVNDTLYDLKNGPLKRNFSSIQIDFSCTNISTKRNVYFQHKLSGEISYDWSIPQKSRTVYLRLLPPGKYQFMVRAIDGFNDLNPIITTFEFEVLPLFYQTLWFKIGVFLLLVGIIILLARNRVQVVRKRTEEIEMYSRKVAEIELKAIQAQLNPHFIFNCLNSIKYSIMSRNFDDANNSLNTFASLIRNSLENYDKFFVPFNQELKFITDYIELEKLRLKERLDYVITGTSNIAYDCMVPHLIIQPHIENAIKHGISNLENKTGYLSVEFEKTDKEIICTISDNGIGRAASRLLNEKNKRHISKGTQLTYEKSAFLKQYNNYTCSIQIVDLHYTNNEASGTRVIIKLPNTNDNRNNR